MELTKNSIIDIITSGVITNSALANMYIAHVKKTYGLTIVACYCDASKLVEFPQKIKPNTKLTSADLKWLHTLSLQIYVKGHVLANIELENNLMNAFEFSVNSLGLTIDYLRSYSPEELSYYGWNNKRRSEWNLSKVIVPNNLPIERKTLMVESFDDLVLWHCMSNSLKKLNALRSVKEISAKIYCGWDEGVNSMNLFVIVPETFFKRSDMLNEQVITNDLYSVLTSYDKFNIIENIKLKPKYTMWSDLSSETKFALLRDVM